MSEPTPVATDAVAAYQRDKGLIRKKLAEDQLVKDSKYIERLRNGIEEYNKTAQQSKQNHLERVEQSASWRREQIAEINRKHDAEVARATKQRDHGIHSARIAWDHEKKATLDCAKKARISLFTRYEKEMGLLQAQHAVTDDKDDNEFIHRLNGLTRARDLVEAFVIDDEEVAASVPSPKAVQTRKRPAVAAQAPISETRAQASMPDARSPERLSNAVPQSVVLDNPGESMEEAQNNTVVEVFQEHPEPGLLETAPNATANTTNRRRRALREPEPGMMPAQYVNNRELSPQPWPTRTTTYDEVYQGGNAEFKHVIIPWQPKGTAKRYYILRCDEHHVHFGKYPTHGAAKHLWSAAHRAKDKAHARAIAMIGIEVLGCDDVLMGQNNAVAVEAMSVPGWKPLNVKTKKARVSFGVKHESPEPAARPLQRPQPRQRPPAPAFKGITRPKPRHLYIGTCKEAKNPVLVLGWENDLTSAGQPDNYRSTHLPREPECYRFDPVTKDIVGWAAGYEDDGPKEHLREFPVLWACDVDPDGDPCWGMMWAQAELLSKFDIWTTDDDDALRISVRHYFAHDVHGFPNLETMALAKGKKLKQYIILSEDDDNLTVFSRTPSVSLSPPTMATQPIAAFKRKVGRPLGSKTKRHSTAGRPQQAPLPDAQQPSLDSAAPPTTTNKRVREEAEPDGASHKRPRHSLPSTRPKKHSKPSRISTGGMSAPEKPENPEKPSAGSAQPPRAGFTAVNAASSLPTPSTHNDVWVKPEQSETPARDQLHLLSQAAYTKQSFATVGTQPRTQPQIQPLSIPSRGTGNSAPHQSSMATPISASPSAAPVSLHDGDDVRKDVEDVFHLVGVIRRKDSWARPLNTERLLRLQVTTPQDGQHVAESVNDAPIKLKINPKEVVHARRISSGPDQAQANLTLVMNDEEEITLMFTRDVRGRDSRAATLAARQFQRWLVARNNDIELPKTESHRYGLPSRSVT